MDKAVRHSTLLQGEKAVLLVVDIQERIHAVMAHRERVTENVRKLVQGFRVLGLPIVVTEQYPKGLGHTVPELREVLEESQPIEKIAFSCGQVSEVRRRLEELHAKQVVLVGIEAHVCILQTALDLLQLGYQVHLPGDAVSSRRELDWDFAIQRMRQAGVIVCSTEAVLFELLVQAGTPEFKQVSALVK